MPGIYIASKTYHAAQWRLLRSAGVPIISTWIDEAGAGETKCFTDLWRRCVAEACAADVLIVYRDDGDFLKGALVEVGAALAAGKLVIAVGCGLLTFTNHPLVIAAPDLGSAFALARQHLSAIAA